jgi:deoxyribonuclease V
MTEEAITPLHRWDLTPEEAIALQLKLAGRVIHEDRLGEVHAVAGVDMAINEEHNTVQAAVVLLKYPEMELIEQHIYEEKMRMPYIPGLLSFREAPAVLGAFQKLRHKADLVMADGQGIAHPRRIGIASHLGLWLNLPTIGCAKSILIGKYDEEKLGKEVGNWLPLVYKGEILGAAVRTRTNVSPMYISLGHMISLETSIKYVLACGKGYRLPETTRLADKLSKNNSWVEPSEENNQPGLWS